MENRIQVSLPNGDTLIAVKLENTNYPSIQLFLKHEGSKDEENIAFVEYNPEKPDHEMICIGVYNATDDEPVYYESYKSKGGENYDDRPENN